MLSIDEKLRLSHLLIKKLKTKYRTKYKINCKKKYKTSMQSFCNSNIGCNCSKTKSYQKFYKNSLIYIPFVFFPNS